MLYIVACGTLVGREKEEWKANRITGTDGTIRAIVN
jgi:hypothetical protein